ncbi:MAG: glycosyltransferase family 2 protein [Patescibacteria group bacterium]|nr:glycosyltransferase family 2 protein [bacterium]MDZ4240719.1 glycosyltransferase family 2 protein [Patescibacteria group bacterium]
MKKYGAYPLISVIIPTHNNAGSIGLAIESMLTQTYPNIEIIVVDDHSTDTTADVVKDIVRKNPNVSYYLLPWDDPVRFSKTGRNINAGYLARNYGLTRAKGEWITFQDGDDASLANRIEAQYDLALKHNASHVCIQWMRYSPDLIGKQLDVERVLLEHPDAFIDKEYITALAHSSKGIIIPLLGKLNSKIPFEIKAKRVINKLFFGSLASYPGSGNSPLFKREIIDKVRFRKSSERVWPSFVGRGADRDFNFQVSETFKNSVSFNLPLYLYKSKRQNEGFEGYEKYLKP